MGTDKKVSNITLCLTIILCLLFVQTVWAQKTWVGGTDNNWSTGANWSPAGAPGPADAVTIPNTFTTFVDGSFGGSIASLTLGGGLSGSVTLQRSLIVSGNITINSGASFSAGSQNLQLGGNLTINSTATFNAGTGTIFFINGGGSTQTLNSFITTLTLNNVTVSQGLLNAGAGVIFDDRIGGVTGVQFNINGTLTMSFPDQVGLALNNSGGGGAPLINYGLSSTLVYNGVNPFSQSSQVPGAEFTTSLNNLTVSVAATYTNGVDMTGLTAVTRAVAFDLNLSSGKLTNDETLQVGGNVSTGTLTTNGSYVGSTLEMNGINIQNISAGSGSIQNLTINKTAGVVRVTNGILNITDKLTIQNRTLQLLAGSTGLNISGGTAVEFEIQSGGIFQTGGKSITCSNYDLQPGSIFDFNGTSKESTPSGLAFSTLRLSNSGGLDIIGNVTVSGPLDFYADGTVNVNGTNTLTLGTGASITGIGVSTSRYVNGPLRKEFSGTGSFDYHIGKTTNYRPATFEYTTNTGTGNSIIEIEWSTDAFTPNSPPNGISTIDQQSHYIVQEVGATPTNIEYDFTGTFEDANFSPESRNRALVETASSYTLSATNTVDGVANTVESEDFTVLPAGSNFMVFGAGGTSLVWDGGGAPDDWNIANNWSPNGVPTSQDDVTIDLSVVVTVTIGSSTSAVASSLTIGDNAGTENVLLISSNSATPLTVTNAITVNSDGKLNFNASNGDISAGSTTFNTGSTVEYQARNIPVDGYGNLIINGATGTTGSGTITVAGGLTKDGSAFTASNAITVNGSYSNTSGNATYNNGLTVNGTAFGITSGIISGTITINSTTTTVDGTAGSFGGTVTYSGSGAQSIGGTGTIPFASLTINNTTNDITLNQPVSVSGTFTLTDGLVNTSTNLLTLGSSATVSGGSSSSYVNGPMAITNATGPQTFPIGKSSYRPVTTNLSSAATPTVQFEVSDLAPNYSFNSPLVHISTVRYWLGTLSGTITGGSVNLTYGPDDGVQTTSSLLMAYSVNNSAAYASLGGTGSGAPSGNITGTLSGTALGYFTLGTSAFDNSLPVELSVFAAQPDYNMVTLTWATESEIENEGFNIYRRDMGDDNQWQLLNTSLIPGQGNTPERTDYEYVDNTVAGGYTYEYMLESISYAGVRVQEKVIEVLVPVPTEYATLGNYPNPFNPTTNIGFRLPETSEVSILIYGIQGNLVRELALNQSFEAGDHFVTWDATDNSGQQVASGMYVYLFTAGKFKKTEKMLLLK